MWTPWMGPFSTFGELFKKFGCMYEIWPPNRHHVKWCLYYPYRLCRPVSHSDLGSGQISRYPGLSPQDKNTFPESGSKYLLLDKNSKNLGVFAKLDLSHIFNGFQKWDFFDFWVLDPDFLVKYPGTWYLKKSEYKYAKKCQYFLIRFYFKESFNI